MGKYLDPKSDIVFKKIFYDYPHLLISFLNAVLPLSLDGKIVELSYLANEQIPTIPAFKRTIVDVKCKDQRDRTFIVEIQIDWQECFMQRLLFGTAQAYVNQLERGESYDLLGPVYGLGILNDKFDFKSNDWYHHYNMVKVNDPRQEVIKGLTLVFVELPKCPINTHDDRKLMVLWLRFLRELGEQTDEVDPALLDVPEISQAIEYTKQTSYTKKELDAYESYWKAVSIEKTLRQASLAKGRIEGLAEGRIEGLAEGRVDGLKTTAKNMKDEGFPLEIIMKCTHLTKAEIDLL